MMDPNQLLLSCIGFPVCRDMRSILYPRVDREGYALKPYDCSGERIWWAIPVSVECAE